MSHTRRTKARERALQALYQIDVAAEGIDEALARFWRSFEPVEREVMTLAEALVRGVAKHRRHIDEEIERVSSNWRLDRMAKVDRNVLRRVARSERHDAVVALGAVIRGGTPHFEYVASEVSKGVAHVSMEADCAVTMGVLTCDTMEQALERAGVKAGNKGADTAVAAIEQANAFKAVSASGRTGKRSE